jgi:hypothetical protein
MASEILGLFTTPDMYRMQQQEALDRRALQFAQLTPFQRAEMSLYKGGANLASGLGSLLGVEDPQLRMISQRQQLSQGLDMTDPASVMKIAEQAAQLGDMQFATTLADYARKAQVDIATAQQKMREKTGVAAPIQVAQTRAQLLDQKAQLEGLPDSPDKARAMAMIDNTLAALTATSRQGQIPDAIEIARERAALKGLTPGTDAYNVFVDKTIESLTTKSATEKRSAFAQELVDAGLDPATDEFKNLMVRHAEAQIEGKRKGQTTEVKLALPGQGKTGAEGVPAFRNEVIRTIDPFLKTVTSADSAIQNIRDSIKTGNYISFNAARVQLAKALGDSTLSRRDIEQAGGDPSLIGGFFDTTSTLFTGTPTIDTQKKIESTLRAIRKVAKEKANAELTTQRKIAVQSGFNADQMGVIFDFPTLGKSAAPTEAPRTNETIPSDVGARVGGAQPPAKAPAAPKKGQKQTITLKSGKVLTVEQE